MYICSMYMWKCLSILGVVALLFTLHLLLPLPTSSLFFPCSPRPQFSLPTWVLWDFLHSFPASPSHFPVPRVVSIVPSCILVHHQTGFPCSCDYAFPTPTVTLPASTHTTPPLPSHTLSKAFRVLPCALSCLLPSITFLVSEVKIKGDAFTVLEEEKCFVNLLWQCTFMYSTVHFGMYHSRLQYTVRSVLHGVAL